MSSLPILYNAWFCPFSQRAWIGFLFKGIQFEYVEQDPYLKTPEWLAINPKGLVPAIQHNGKTIFESQVCLEYLDEMWNNTTNSILPPKPYERAHARIWGDHIGKKIIPPFYTLLMKKTAEEKQEAKEQIVRELEVLLKACAEEGPFFYGEKLGYVDIMVAPWMLLFYLVKHYRDFDVVSSFQDKRLQARCANWLEALKEHPSIKPTIADAQRLIDRYQKYDDGTAKSQVGDAIRKWTSLP